MSLFPDFTDQRLRSPALPKRQRFFFLLISFILPLPCVVSVHGQESAPAGEAVAEVPAMAAQVVMVTAERTGPLMVKTEPMAVMAVTVAMPALAVMVAQAEQAAPV